MSAENEIVMVGGISHATDEVFSTMKVISNKVSLVPSTFPDQNCFFSVLIQCFKVLNASLQEWTDNSHIWPSVYDAIVLPVPKKILKSCNFGPGWM